MRKTELAAMASAVMIGVAATFIGYRGAAAQADPQNGWLEGFQLNESGTVALSCKVALLRNGQEIASVDNNSSQGGYYAFRNVKPGIYEVRATNPYYNKYRALRVWGVVVKPNVRTKLDLTMEVGGNLPMQEIGQPTVETTPVIPLSQKLAHLQAQIDELRKQQAAR